MTVLGIAGGSGCGKTTFVRGLRARLPEGHAVVVAQDAYYHDRSALSDAERRALNFDDPSAIDFALLTEHVRALKAGRPVGQPQYDYLTCARAAQTTPLAPAPVVIVEGILILAHEPLRREIDLALFIDIPDDIRLMQLIERDGAERERDAGEVLRRYRDTVRPMHLRHVQPSRDRADLVLPHGGQAPLVQDLVAGYLLGRSASGEGASPDRGRA
jgi:uridine kinase